MWNDSQRAQALNRERSQLETIVTVLTTLEGNLSDLAELAELAAEEEDSAALDEIQADLGALEEELARAWPLLSLISATILRARALFAK